VSEPAKSRIQFPLEAFPDGAVPLETIICTQELRNRPSRSPEYEKENSALVALASALAESPPTILQTLADKVLELLRADSAGLSLLTKDEKRFYWAAVAGAWRPLAGADAPRNFGPCGDVLDRNVPTLFSHWERRYPYLSWAMPLADEGLLVPFYVNGKAVGTIWAVAHDHRRKFDAEDLRLLERISRFASAAYQAVKFIENLRSEVAAREKAESEVRELANGLEEQVRVRTKQLERNTRDLIESNEALEREIVERKRAEDNLRRSQAFLAEAQRLSLTGSFSWRLGTDEITWSDQLYRIFELEIGMPVTLELIRTRVHPEDLASYENLVEETRNRGTDFEYEYRLRMPDQSIKYLHVVAHGTRDEDGRLEYIGAVQDVTARRTAFEEIKALKDQLYKENVALRKEINDASMCEEIVGSSAALRKVLVEVAKVAPTDSTVLITGETGTGKELIARAIHKRSKRSGRAFICVNCAAIPASLIASELFGHEKGAFTGALQRRAGHFEAADRGTIFLDEIGELSLETQVSLLRVLQEREFQRVGNSQPISVDVRVLAATNGDLNAAVAAGTFRQDLLYRLNVFPIRVPPLRERKDDIPVLVPYVVEQFARRAGKRITEIEKKTLSLLQAYDWPGNIRELQNVIERAVVLCDGKTLSVDETWLQRRSNEQTRLLSPVGVLAHDRKEFAHRELRAIEAALARCQGRVSGPRGAATELGIPRQTLDSKIHSLGIDKRRFKSLSPTRRPA